MRSFGLNSHRDSVCSVVPLFYWRNVLFVKVNVIRIFGMIDSRASFFRKILTGDKKHV
jgi:hypothetical protein